MSTATVVERIARAHETRTPLRIRGAGTWLDAGRPVRDGDTLSIADDRGIVEYVPGDLTLTARAGTLLSEIERATRANEQWLPLAPWGSAESTLGATISTGTAGPHAAAFGLPRDAALGLEFVTGTGDVVRCGGRVVKNVAGFDLTRLLTGSWGTLGVITEATVRLRAMPRVTRSVAIAVGADPGRIEAAASDIRALPFAPFACELVNAALARQLGIGDATAFVVQLGGNATAVAAQLDALRTIGTATDIDSAALAALRNADAGAAVVWRLSGRPTRFAQLWAACASQPDALAHGNVVRGVIRVIGAPIPSRAESAESALVAERLPRQEWAKVPPQPNALAERIRATFDPRGVLNPGILGPPA